MELPGSVIAHIKRRAREAARHAYAPYSSFPVGAAVLADDGQIYAGANVENAAYGLAMCAERNAIFQAIGSGARQIRAVAVYTPTTKVTTPCGACRQVIAEFGSDVLVVCSTDDVTVERHYSIGELLPQAFGPANI
ncbi:MAG: cytidine deaminase [Casimicrobiaceae bacterium]